MKFSKIISLWLFLTLAFLVFNIFFNRHIVLELFQKDEHRSHGQDGLIANYLIENSYQNLKNGKSIFSFNQNVFYPFGTQIVGNDIGFIYVFWFILFRPFLSINSSLQLAIFISFFLCEIVTYSFLRFFKLSKKISFVFSLVFSFAPFISYIRIDQHYNYLQHFLFPLNSWLILLVLKKRKKKILYSVLLGISFSLLVYSTLYYFVMFSLLVFFFVLFWLIVNKSLKLNYVKYKDSFKYFIISLIIFIICISPFIKGFWVLNKTNNLPNKESLIESIIYFSSRNLSFLIPSPTNAIYGKSINSKLPFFKNVEGTSYLGIITLTGIILFLKFKIRKYWPILLCGIAFWLLSLGPYLNFVKPGTNPFDLVIIKFIKLPYFWLSNIPFFSVIKYLRSPIRFATPLMFCMVIIAGFGFEKFLKNSKRANLIFGILLIILLIDQSYVAERKFETLKLPYRAYKIIKEDSQDCTVFEIPFVVQDGLSKFGDDFNANFMYGQLLHNKNVIGGYIPRSKKEYFDYYLKSDATKYFGYLSSDELKSKRKLEKPSLESISDDFDFWNVKYIIVRKDYEKYEIEKDLLQIGYIKILDDGDFDFFKKDLNNKGSLEFNISNLNLRYFVGNWGANNKVFILSKKGELLFKTTEEKSRSLEFMASANIFNYKMNIYINDKLVGKKTINMNMAKYELNIGLVSKGINKIRFEILDDEFEIGQNVSKIAFEEIKII